MTLASEINISNHMRPSGCPSQKALRPRAPAPLKWVSTVPGCLFTVPHLCTDPPSDTCSVLNGVKPYLCDMMPWAFVSAWVPLKADSKRTWCRVYVGGEPRKGSEQEGRQGGLSRRGAADPPTEAGNTAPPGSQGCRSLLATDRALGEGSQGLRGKHRAGLGAAPPPRHQGDGGDAGCRQRLL